jgi:hypothetical protein
VSRPPELRPYRVAVYIVVGAFCAILFFQLIRSVGGELFGRALPDGRSRPATDSACLDDVSHLYTALAARVVEPPPGALSSEALAFEWERWSSRWEDELAAVRGRCNLGEAAQGVRYHLAVAADGLEELRREVSRSGQDTSAEARRVRQALAEARRNLGLRE